MSFDYHVICMIHVPLNKSLSYSSMESGLGGIKVFLRFMGEKSENIENRFQERKFLQSFELDVVRDYCQINFKLESKKKQNHVTYLFSQLSKIQI